MIPMNWVTTFLALMSLALVYWQGWVLLDREEYSSRLGALTISLTGLAAFLQVLLFTGKLIFSYDLHVVMAEGPFVGVGLGVLLMGVSLAAAFGWLIAVTNGPIKWLPGLMILGAGIFIGAVAIAQIHLLQDDSKPLRVYAFDLLSPGLFSWLTLCFIQTVLGRMVHGYKLLRGLLGVAVACWAISLPSFSDLNHVSLWWALFLLCLFVALLLLGWWTMARAHYAGRLMRALAYLLVIVAATASVGLGLRRFDQYDSLLFAAAIVSMVAFLAIVALRVPRNQFSLARLKSSLKDIWKFGRPLYLSRLRWSIKVRKTRFLRHGVLWAVLIGVFGGFFIASYLASTDPHFRLTGLAVGPGLDSTVGLSGIIFMWVLLIEIFGMGPLTADRSELNERGMRESRSPAQRLWTHLRAKARASSRRAAGWFSTTVVGTFSKSKREDAGPAGDTGLSASAPDSAEQKAGGEEKPKSSVGERIGGWASGIAKTLVGVAILIAISEFPNAHQTLVETFQSPTFKDTETEENVGRAVSDEIINSLARIGKQLQPLVIELPASATGTTQFRAPSATDTSASVSGALGKGTSLGLPGGVSVPLDLLLLPIQAPMRWLLGVRVIHGSLHSSDQGYTLLASSSNGETWDVPYIHTTTVNAAIPELADSMAFQIAIRDPSFATLGMGKKWDGFKLFESGQESWDAYQTQNDLDKLTDAITAFRRATQIDPNFALAYYRLGLALQKDGDPAGAVAALRSSVQANPDFVPGYVALASTLQDFDSVRQSTAAIVASPILSEEQSKALNIEAREVWQKVATFPSHRLMLSDEASAYFGLCRGDNFNMGHLARSSRDVEKKREDLIELAYFHCRRAEEIIAQLPAGLRDLPSNRQREASVINYMGLTLYLRQQIEHRTTDWVCAEESSDVGTMDAQGRMKSRYWVGPNTRAAMRYFNLAQVLQPDDQVIACNAALASFGVGDETPMQRLELDPAARLYLGDSLDQMAKDGANLKYYLLAMREYGMAMKLDPDRVWALSGFAYTFWQFRLASGEAMPRWLEPDVDGKAEWSARRAGVLAERTLIGSERISAQATLGEVLLGQSRAEEAIREIKKVHLPKNWVFDELRWDLAQARLCDSAQQQKLHGNRDPQEELDAATALEEIRQSALRRNDEAWLSRLDVLDPHNLNPGCLEGDFGGLYQGQDAGFVLKNGEPVYSADTPCNWETVSATVAVTTGSAPSQFQLHVWGNGSHKIINLQNQSIQNISLPPDPDPKPTRRVYFAQLGVWPKPGQPGTSSDDPRLQFHPVSAVIPIPTYGSADTGCRQNHISLNFVPEPPSTGVTSPIYPVAGNNGPAPLGKQ